MPKNLFKLISILLLLSSSSVFSDEDKWDFCTGCSNDEKEIVAKQNALSYNGAVNVNIGDYDRRNVRSYSVRTIYHADPRDYTGTAEKMFVANEITPSKATVDLVEEVYNFYENIRRGHFTSQELNLHYQTAPAVINSYAIRNTSGKVTDSFNGFMKTAAIETVVRMNAFAAGISDMNINIDFPDGSKAIFSISRLAKVLGPYGTSGDISITLKLIRLIDSQGQEMPLTKEEFEHVRDIDMNQDNIGAWLELARFHAIPITFSPGSGGSGGGGGTMGCIKTVGIGGDISIVCHTL